MHTCSECGQTFQPKEILNNDGCIRCYACATDGDYLWYPSNEWSTQIHGHDLIGSTRRFGVELETQTCPRYEIWGQYDGWGAKSDASIRGVEFVSPPLSGNGGYDSVVELCKRLQENGSQYDDDCGYHVHLDLTDSTSQQRKAMALAYHYTTEFWQSLVPEDRMDNENLDQSEWDTAQLLRNSDYPMGVSRYIWCNWNAYDQHQTVEIRIHHATIDAKDVLSWVRAHAIFMDFVQDMSCEAITEMFEGADFGIFTKVWPIDLFRHYSNVRRQFA